MNSKAYEICFFSLIHDLLTCWVIHTSVFLSSNFQSSRYINTSSLHLNNKKFYIYTTLFFLIMLHMMWYKYIFNHLRLFIVLHVMILIS